MRMSKCMECKNDNYWAYECQAGTDDILVANGVIAECTQFIAKTCNTDEKPAETKEDPVNSPSHYQHGGIETIDIIRTMLTPEEFRGYLKGNILKYRERAPYKGNTDQDYAKAKKYYEWLKEVSE